MRGIQIAALILAIGSQAQASPTHTTSLACISVGMKAKFPTADVVITYTPRREADALELAKTINQQYIDNPTSSGVTLVMKSRVSAWESGKVLYNTVASKESEAAETQRILAGCGVKSVGSWTPSPRNGDYLDHLAIGLD